MSVATKDPLVTLAVVGVLGLIAYIVFRGPGGVAKDTAKAGVNVLTGAVVGTVTGIGEAVGIPETSMTKCQKALAAGNYWDASFDCPASDFLGGVFGKKGDVAVSAGNGDYGH